MKLRSVPKVDEQPVDITPEDILSDLLPELERTERNVRMFRKLIDEQGRLLAKERGVAFIRFEHLKREFGQ